MPKATGYRGTEMISFLKSAQLATSLGVIALFWLIYPGVMVAFAAVVGIIYVAVAIGAILNNQIAIWTAFVFSIITAILSAFGVRQLLRNGFDFVAGNFGQQDEFAFHPYLFLIISLGAVFVVIAHLVSWRWMVSGMPKDTP